MKRNGGSQQKYNEMKRTNVDQGNANQAAPGKAKLSQTEQLKTLQSQAR